MTQFPVLRSEVVLVMLGLSSFTLFLHMGKKPGVEEDGGGGGVKILAAQSTPVKLDAVGCITHL